MELESAGQFTFCGLEVSGYHKIDLSGADAYPNSFVDTSGLYSNSNPSNPIEQIMDEQTTETYWIDSEPYSCYMEPVKPDTGQFSDGVFWRVNIDKVTLVQKIKILGNNLSPNTLKDS